MTERITPASVETIFEGRVFTLRRETVRLPKGGVLQAEIVRHPGSVVIVPLTDAGDVILVRQYRHAIGRWAWELPAGSLKPGEDVEAAAVRECHEEVGLVPDRLQRLGAFYPTPGYCDELMNIYLATGLRPPHGDEQAQQDEDEDIEARPFAPDAIAEMIDRGEVIDLKTVAGLALLRPKAGGGSSRPGEPVP
jgi:ADP-ribose pyrophosphatase